jgi:hypothetical protein
MAKTRLGSTDPNLDNELDIPDFDFDFGDPPPDDRTPVEKILTGVKQGASYSFKNNSGFIKRLIRATLPPVYGEVEDLANLVTNNTAQLYNRAVREIKPSISQLTKSAEKLLPGSQSKTKSALKSIQDWADDYKSKTFSNEDRKSIQDRNIAIEIADIFSKTAQRDEEVRKEEKITSILKEAIEGIRHRESIGSFSAMQHHIERMSQYQEKITQAYQKKSLELQYRSYFVQAESLEQSKGLFELAKTSFASIIKNTGLPEYVKLRDSERFKELAKTKLTESLFGTAQTFINKTFANVGVKVKEYTEEFKDLFSAAAFGLEQAELAKEMGALEGKTSFLETLAKEGTSAGIQYGALRLGSKFREKLEKNKTVKSITEQAQYGINNLPELLTQYANSQNIEDSNFKAGFKNILRDVIGNQNPDASITNDNSLNASSVGLFSQQTNKSIIEIIPGYLARILREIQVFRTGNEKIQLTTYDPYSNKFTDSKSVKESIMSRLIPEGSVRAHTESGDDIFEKIDPENKLSPDQRSKILDMLTKDRFNRRLMTSSRLSSASNFERDEELAPDAEKIADLFKTYFTNNGQVDAGSDIAKQKEFELNKLTSRLGRFLNNPGSEIQNLVNMGYYEQLRDIGLINDIGSAVNMEEVIKLHNPANRSKATLKDSILSNIDNSTDSSMISRSFVKPEFQKESSDCCEQIKESIISNSEIIKEIITSNKEAQKRFDRFIEENTTVLEKLDFSTVSDSLNTATNTTNEILSRIEDFLINALPQIMTMSSSNEHGQNNEGRNKDLTVKGLIKGVGGFIHKRFLKPIHAFNMFTIKQGINNTKRAYNGLFGAMRLPGKLAAVIEGAKDVYYPGEENPRLTKQGFKEGNYFDSITGKIIKRFDDLKKSKGNIVDKEGNILLTRDDLPKILVKDNQGGILHLGKKLITGTFGLAKSYSSFTTKQFFRGTSLITGAASWSFNKVKNLLDRPTDIFIKGSSTPVLLAAIMRTGGYFSKRTGKPIFKPSEIDGPIVDSEGNVVLTEEQMKIGIVDKYGKAISTPLMKVLGFGASVVGGAVRMAMNIGRMGTNIITGGLTKTGDLLKGIVDGLTGGSMGSGKSLDVLEQIRDILDSRLPENKTIHGDRDGDGDRDNSWQDIFSKKKDSESTDKDSHDHVAKPNRKNTFDRISDTVSSIKDSILGALGLGDGGVDVDINTGDGSKRPRKGRKGGLMRKGGGILGAGGRAALGAAGWLGKGALAGGAMAITGLAKAATLTAAAVPAILGGIGAVVSSPIFLTGAALALTGYAGYKAYKYFTKKETTHLVKMRMVQYGLSIDEADKYPLIFDLEQRLSQYVSYSDDQAELKVEDKIIFELLKMFGIEPNNYKSKSMADTEKWVKWFNERFKPVYLTHLSVLRKLSSNIKLSDVDSLESEEKIKYINAASFEEGPYNVLVSPFPDLRSLGAGLKLVQYHKEQALKEANEEKEKQNKDNKPKAAIAAAAAAVDSNKNDSSTETNVKPVKSSGFMDAFKKSLSVFKSPIFLVSPFAALATITVKSVGQKLGVLLGFGVTALEAIRFKTYGLTDLTRSKVSSIRALERELIDKVTFDSNGLAYYNESMTSLLDKMASEFGLSVSDPDKMKIWSYWFQHRFLPVYLTYVGLVRQSTGGSKATIEEKTLSEHAKLEIAKKISTVNGVWNIPEDPWGTKASNLDKDSIKENIDFLEHSAKDKKLDEQKTNVSPLATTPVKAAPVIKSNSTHTTDPGNKGTWNRIESPSDKQSSTEVYRDKYDIKAKDDRDKLAAATKPKTSRNFSGFGDDIDNYIKEASKMYNIEESILRGFIKMEDGWTGKMSPTGAIGTGQFIQSTWDSLAQTEEGKAIGMTKIGSRFRTADDPRHDKKINTLATALLAKKNAELLTKAGLPINGENLYMVHNIGPGVIPAIKGEGASPAVIKAMQLNGMKAGMSPQDFVEYQKRRFNSHYEAANNTRSAQDPIPIGRPSQSTQQENKVGSAANSNEALSSIKKDLKPPQLPSTPVANSSSYMGSVERTKPNPGNVQLPNIQSENLPKTDEFTSIMRNTRRPDQRGQLPRSDTSLVINAEVNNSVIAVNDTLRSSLDIQTQMLGELREIKTKFPNLASRMEEPRKEIIKPKDEDSFQKASNVQKGRPSSMISKAPVNMGRS